MTNPELQGLLKVKAVKIGLKISVEESPAKAVSNVAVKIKEEAETSNSVCKRQSLLQKKFRIKSNRHWRDFRVISPEAKPNPEETSAPNETVRWKWREKNPKY